MKKTYEVVCKNCHTFYKPSSRPYTCPTCSHDQFYLSPHEYQLQRYLQEGEKDLLGAEIFILTKKLMWRHVLPPLMKPWHLEDLYMEVVFQVFRIIDKQEEIKCFYALINYLCFCVTSSEAKKILRNNANHSIEDYNGSTNFDYSAFE